MPSIAIPVSLRGQLLNSVRAVTAFSPSTLFTLAEPGLWLDPSDVANLAWRRNLLTWTEQFDNAAWGKANATVTANAGVAPDGTTTADLLTGAATTAAKTTFNVTTTLLNVAYTWTVYAKYQNNRWFALNAYSGTGGDNFTFFDVQNGVVGTVGSGATASITALSNGWYRCSVTRTATATASGGVGLNLASADGVTTFPTSSGGQTVLIWGAQLELGSTATEYQRITDVNTEVIERFPSATLYQDTAGTIPVTGPTKSDGTPVTVALALDKSKGLVLGPELVTNGTFDTNITGWTAAVGSGTLPTLSLSSNRLRIAANENSQAASAYASITTVVGRTYSFSAQRFTVTPNSSLMTFAASTSTSTSTANFLAQTGTAGNTCVFVATGTTTYIHARISGTIVVGDTWEVDNISVKELPGFHATQATTASRPIYGINPVGGRRNALVWTEQFENAAWTKVLSASVSANSETSPVGDLTADTFIAGAANSALRQTTTLEAVPYTFSVWIKRKTGTGNVEISVTGGSWAIRSVTSAWTRFTVTQTPTAGSNFPGIRMATSGDEVYVWGAQLETGSTATAYQKVTTQYDVTEAGVASVSYLAFDGVDDFMVTPTITPGIDKVTVGAGVRKLSNTPTGILVEHSANLNTNNGSFVFALPVDVSPTGRSSFRNKGTTAVEVFYASAAPVTEVISGLGNISGDLVTVRANGVQIDQSTSDQGTGNYLAYPLYIGRRGGTTLPFSGNIYSLVVRFAATDVATVGQLETWINGKTGAYS